MNRRACLLAGSAAALLALPLLLSLSLDASGGAPPGQGAYLMMRPAGHLAFVLAFFQIVLSLHGESLSRWAGLPGLMPLSRALSLSALSFAFLHPLLLLFARMSREGFPLARLAMETFLPDPSKGAWPLACLFGALSFWGLAGSGLSPKRWHLIQVLPYPAFFLAWYHVMLMGSSVRDQFLGALYTLLAASAAGMMLFRVVRR